MPRVERAADGSEYEYDDDGRCTRVKVPVVLMDGGDPVQAAVAASKAAPGSYEAYCRDAAAEAQRHREIGATLYSGRPGFVPISDAKRQARAERIAEHKQQLSNAWQRPRTAPAADAKPAQPFRNADAEVARREYIERTANAWRSPR